MSGNKIRSESGDWKYYTVIPRIVWALSRTLYDHMLWCTIKTVAGENGECYLSTETLAALSMMSTGKVSDCRKYLIAAGLLRGEVRKDPGYPQPVWHLTIPDLWRRNIEWAEQHSSIKKRLTFKKSLHQVKASPGEEGYSPGEEGYSPGETKNNHKNNQKKLPAPKSAQVTEPGAKEPSYAPGKELEYVPVEEEEGYKRASLRHKYEIPETQFQRDFLAVCKAKSFKPCQKTKVKKLTKCLAIGAGFLQEADGYRRCIEELEGHTDFPDRPLAMPASWYDWRAKHAREHRWSVNGFIGALFDRDALVRHCQYKLKQLGATESDEKPAVPAPYDPPSGPVYS